MLNLPLSKSCTKEYNIKHGTIKLGTLNEYKETEIEQIQDKEEGHLRFHLKFDGEVTVSNEWFNTLSDGAIGMGNNPEPHFSFPGEIRARFEHFTIAKSTNSHVTIRDTSAIIEREALNSFVFCMSKVRKLRDCIGIFPEYNDYWYIAEGHRLDFCRVLGELLLEAIVNGHKTGNYIIPADTPLEELTIYRAAHPVRYIPRDTHITNENILALEEFKERMIHISFTKPEVFQHEAEFRFMYDIVVGGNYVQPIVNSIILDATRLQCFICQP